MISITVKINPISEVNLKVNAVIMMQETNINICMATIDTIDYVLLCQSIDSSISCLERDH